MKLVTQKISGAYLGDKLCVMLFATIADDSVTRQSQQNCTVFEVPLKKKMAPKHEFCVLPRLQDIWNRGDPKSPDVNGVFFKSITTKFGAGIFPL